MISIRYPSAWRLAFGSIVFFAMYLTNPISTLAVPETPRSLHRRDYLPANLTTQELVFNFTNPTDYSSLVAKSCELRTDVLDSSGKVVASMSAEQMIPPGEMMRFDQTSAPVANPRLWSPETPSRSTRSSRVAHESACAVSQ